MFSDMFFNALTLIGGLAFFLYGMHVMGEGLTKLSGGRMEQILERLTHSRLKAVLFGTVVTAVIQSSSATTVTVVGFVNSGILKLRQAVGVIMGANIGTTVTSWLLSLVGIQSSSFFVKLLKPSSFTPILALIGVLLIVGSKREKRRDVGVILIGFSVLMFGMDTMSTAVKPLADIPAFTGMLTMFSHPVLGMLMGALLTAVIQSSSASIGILQALCATGAVTYATAIPIIMGQNIGTCVTALLSSVGAGRNAKRAALVHLYFNLIGTIVFMLAFYGLHGILRFGFMSEVAGTAGIAVIHSLFNIGATLFLLPFAGGLERLAVLSVREGKEERDKTLTRLDVRFLDRPLLALEQCKASADDMAYLVLGNVTSALENVQDYSGKKHRRLTKTEERIDRYAGELTEYLRQMALRNAHVQEETEWRMLLYAVRELARIGDHACQIMEEAEKIGESKAAWTGKLRGEISGYASEVQRILADTVDVFVKRDPTRIRAIEDGERRIAHIHKQMKKQNVRWAKKEKYPLEVGFFVHELSLHFERVADHCGSIALHVGETVTIHGS